MINKYKLRNDKFRSLSLEKYPNGFESPPETLPELKTQQDCWKWLADGGKLRHKAGKRVVFFDQMGGFGDNHWDFSIPDFWEIYIEPPKWYENMTKPILCESGDVDFVIAISYFRDSNTVTTLDDEVFFPEDLTPLTLEEVKRYIYGLDGDAA